MSKEKTAEATTELEQPTEQQTPQEAAEQPVDAAFMDDPEVLAYINLKVQEGVQKALQGKTPKANTADPTAAERAAFQKMSYKERLKLYNSNPHDYHKLAKGSM